ncbi:hypothetical protein RSOLAG22IIIB_11399 [Rhizoctonia solani]|uniref:Uncharacterized protein n=1 Tax=Rhizoctonia solani TaxID=456999 RepID=A0A0K6G7R4_9AGAM|nr:hypothetical protein RSOLAG22IIIB_11399 [Rhizoctonia solani]
MISSHGCSRVSSYSDEDSSDDREARREAFRERVMREHEEREHEIQTNPQAAKEALLKVKEGLNKDAVRNRYNYPDFATHLKGGEARSEAEQDRFLKNCNQQLNSHQFRLDDIPTHNDSDLEGLKERIGMGIDNYRGKVTAPANRSSR